MQKRVDHPVQRLIGALVYNNVLCGSFELVSFAEMMRPLVVRAVDSLPSSDLPLSTLGPFPMPIIRPDDKSHLQE